MWSQVRLVLLLSLLGRDMAHKREKRTIGILFRGLVDAVTGPTAPLASLTYPSDENDRRTTPRPDSRPQTQVFFVPLPERQRRPFDVEIEPPAPLKPADLAEIHIHPQLVKQLETLARAQSIRGKMIAKRYPLNATVSDDEYQALSEERTTVRPPPPKKTPMKYTVKILPEDDKGGLSVTIAVGMDGKVRIVPNKDKIKLNVNMTKKKNSDIKGGIKSLLKDVGILKSNSSGESERPRPDHGDGPASFPPYHGPVFTPEFPGGPVVPALPPGGPVLPAVPPGGPVVPVLPPGGPALINNVPGPAFLYGDTYGLPPGPLGIPAGNPTDYPPHQEVYPPYNTVFNPTHNNHESQSSKQTSRPYSEVEPFKDFLDFLGLSDSPSPQQPSHPSSQHSPPRLPVHNLPLNNSPSHSYPPYNSSFYNFPPNNLPSHHFPSHSPTSHNLPPHHFPPHDSPSQNFPSHDSPSHNQISPTKPLKFTDGNSGKGFGIHQDSRPFSQDHLDSNRRPFPAPGPSGYPGFPPLPGANGFINTIAEEFPSSYFPTHFPVQQPPPFTQGPNFSPGSQLNFPQHSYGFPSNFPLRRSDNSTENCEKKSNQTC